MVIEIDVDIRKGEQRIVKTYTIYKEDLQRIVCDKAKEDHGSYIEFYASDFMSIKCLK